MEADISLWWKNHVFIQALKDIWTSEITLCSRRGKGSTNICLGALLGKERGKHWSAFPRISSMDTKAMTSYNPYFTAEVASELHIILQTAASFCYTIASHRKPPLERLLRAFILMWETIIVLQASQSSRTKKFKKKNWSTDSSHDPVRHQMFFI